MKENQPEPLIGNSKDAVLMGRVLLGAFKERQQALYEAPIHQVPSIVKDQLDILKASNRLARQFFVRRDI